jgi:rhodanese-related sulfurtransferase
MVCRSGARSGRAAAALLGMGFTDVTNLTGGMLAWNAAGLPVVQS